MTRGNIVLSHETYLCEEALYNHGPFMATEIQKNRNNRHSKVSSLRLKVALVHDFTPPLPLSTCRSEMAHQTGEGRIER